MNKNLRVVGITISITWIAFIALAILIKALGFLFDSWFRNNALIIVIISAIIVLVGIITGAISLGAMTSKGKGFFG